MADEIHNPEATILDEIDTWHSANHQLRPAREVIPLHDYLGLDWQEYRAWVENRTTIEQLVARRKAP